MNERVKELRHICRKKLMGALSGYRFWVRLLKKEHILSDDAIILIPTSTDLDCVEFAAKYLRDFLQRSHLRKAVFLTRKREIEEYIDKYDVRQNVITVIQLNCTQECDLLDYYNANMRDERFVVASLDVPDGRILTRYLSNGCVEKEELFSMAIYNLPPNTKDGGYPVIQLPWKRRLLRKLSAVPYIGLGSYYFFCIRNGRKIYERLKKEFGEDTKLLLCPHTGTGDIYNIGLFFDAYLKEKDIKNYVFLFLGASEKKVGALFGIRGDVLLTKREALQLARTIQFLGPSNVDIVQLHHYPLAFQAHVHTENLEGYEGLTLHETFKRVTMELDADTTSAMPKFEAVKDVEDRFRQLGLIPGKTVILAPYTTSAAMIRVKEWEEIASMLISKGYSVATNCGKASELPIHGSTALRFEYKHAKAYLECAGYFIGARSGFCDVVSSAKCAMIILTPYSTAGTMWLGKEGKTRLFYGIKENYSYAESFVTEIEYEDDRSHSELAKLLGRIW